MSTAAPTTELARGGEEVAAMARLGAAAAHPPGLEACVTVLSRQPSSADPSFPYQAAIAVVDGSASEFGGDVAAGIVTDLIEAALRSGRAPTVGAGLAMALHEAAETLALRSRSKHDPARLRCSAGVAVLDGGNWTFVEVGACHVFLQRGRSTGPVFRPAGESDPVLGDEGCAPRITTARAQPGDQVLLLGAYTAGHLDPALTARALRLAPDVAAGSLEAARLAAETHRAPQAVGAIALPRPPRASRAWLLPALVSMAFMAAAAGLGFLAWTGGPTRPIIPPEARDANLMPLASTPAQEAPAPNLVDLPGAPQAAEAAEEGKVKIIGAEGVHFEVVDLSTEETVLAGEVREGQDSFVSQPLPAPAEYAIRVWASPRKVELLAEDPGFRMEPGALRIVDSREGDHPEPRSEQVTP